MRAFLFLIHPKWFPALGLVVTLVAGCASGLSKNECRLADWRAIGYEDGVKGQPEAQIGKHRKACAEHGFAINFETYRDGWDEGVRRYCQPGNGFHQGHSGREYTGICPASVEPAFLDAYEHGLELYRLESEVRRITRTLKSKHHRAQHIETEIRDTGIELVAAEIPTERRVVLLDEIRKLVEERAAIEAEIPLLEKELNAAKNRLASVDAGSAY